MNAMVWVGMVAIIGGIAVGLQGPLASLIGQRLGAIESVFIVHLGGAIGAGLILLFYRGGSMSNWRNVPWYALCAGLFGLIVISALTFTIPRIGATASFLFLVCGQLIIGLVLDQFGLFGITQRSIEPVRLLGIVVAMLGFWMLVR